jgi:hypothetical protein
MIDRARELVEELQITSRDLRALRPEQKREMENATGFSANACSHLFAEVADFIEQSLTPPEGDTPLLTLDEEAELVERINGNPNLHPLPAAVEAFRNKWIGDHEEMLDDLSSLIEALSSVPTSNTLAIAGEALREAREEEFCRELLAKQYEEGGREGPYPSYADLARRGAGDFTLCSIKAIKAALRHGYAIAMEARQGGDGETRLHPKDDSAGRQASPNPSPESEA